jgi:transcriptional antiterminator RfaH
MSHWACARTHPNSEKIAINNLLRQDFSYYQPLIQEKKLIKGKIKLVEVPLFPCYLFIKVVDKWRSLQSTHGIASIVPGSVQEYVIDSLKSREQNGYIQLPKAKMFEVGDRVTINKPGSFYGQEALVERMSTKERQRVLLALLSGGIKVLVNEDEIQAA